MRRHLILFGMLMLVTFVFVTCGDDPAPTTSNNHAPGEPAISGAPASGATGVSITPTLNWTCTDADGDALVYTVLFGTSATPPVVSTDQAASSYSPATLAYSTVYYGLYKPKIPLEPLILP